MIIVPWLDEAKTKASFCPAIGIAESPLTQIGCHYPNARLCEADPDISFRDFGESAQRILNLVTTAMREITAH